MKKLIFSLFALMTTMSFAQNNSVGDHYLYCHMSDNGEWTAYAISEDAENWIDLIDGGPVFDPKQHALIEGGTRDAFITRSADGKKFLMVTTDMRVEKSGQWWNYGIDLLTSDDLINWKSTTFDFRDGAGIFSDPDSPDTYKDYSTIRRVWAPQIFWNPDYQWADGRKGGYMIYYSLLNDVNGEDEYDRMYYSYADENFNTLTKPRLMFDWGYATIDADINYLDTDGKYHMMIKKEGGKPGLYTATSKKLEGPYGAPNDKDYINFEGKKLCEGVSAFRVDGEDGWRIAYIEYSSSPKHYRICHADKNMTNFNSPADIKGVSSPQHGSFMRITKEEYDRLKDWSDNYKVGSLTDGWLYTSPDGQKVANCRLMEKGKGVYTRSLYVPKSMKGKPLAITFDGPGQVFVNGKSLESAPLSELVKYDRINDIKVIGEPASSMVFVSVD